MVWYVMGLVAGAAGAAWGLVGFGAARIESKDKGVKFDLEKFGWTLFAHLVSGFAAGVATSEPTAAIAAGFGGQAILKLIKAAK